MDIHLDEGTDCSGSAFHGQTQIIPVIRMDPLSTTSRVGVDSSFRYVGQDTAGCRWVATAPTGFVSDGPGYLSALAMGWGGKRENRGLTLVGISGGAGVSLRSWSLAYIRVVIRRRMEGDRWEGTEERKGGGQEG